MHSESRESLLRPSLKEIRSQSTVAAWLGSYYPTELTSFEIGASSFNLTNNLTPLRVPK